MVPKQAAVNVLHSSFDMRPFVEYFSKITLNTREAFGFNSLLLSSKKNSPSVWFETIRRDTVSGSAVGILSSFKVLELKKSGI